MTGCVIIHSIWARAINGKLIVIQAEIDIQSILQELDPGPGYELVGVGIDVEELERLQEVMARRPRFIQRWFSKPEQMQVESAIVPAADALFRFCLKEAVIKACWPEVQLTPAQVDTSDCGIEQVCEPRITKSANSLFVYAKCRFDVDHALAWAVCYNGAKQVSAPSHGV